MSALAVKPAFAQARPKPVGELAAGTLLFADDGVVEEGCVGNVTVDLVRPLANRPRLVTPFVVAGAGLFQTAQRFPNNETFTSSEGAFAAGGGVRALVGNALILGAEARIGRELHIRVNAIVGVRFGR